MAPWDRKGSMRACVLWYTELLLHLLKAYQMHPDSGLLHCQLADTFHTSCTGNAPYRGPVVITITVLCGPTLLIPIRVLCGPTLLIPNRVLCGPTQGPVD